MLRLFVLAGCFALAPASFAQAPLIADEVFVASPADVSATSFGTVSLVGRSVDGIAVIGQTPDGKAQFQMLGCLFDLELAADNANMRRVASVLSRKLTSIAGDDPPSAGQGILSHPRPVGITDPVTSIGCNPKLHHIVFLFRQEAAGRGAAVEALVFELNAEGDSVFSADSFFGVSEKPSIQARDAVRAARGFFRATFRSDESIGVADQERAALMRGLIMVAPKLLGLPLP